MVNKTTSFNYLEHPVPLPGVKFGQQSLYVSEGGPLGSLWGNLLNECWRTILAVGDSLALLKSGNHFRNPLK